MSSRVLSCVVAFCYVMLGSDWPKHAQLSHAPQGRTHAHLLAEAVPGIPTAVKKVIPLFVLSSRAQSLSGIGLSMFHRGGPAAFCPYSSFSCRRMFKAWGGTLIGRSHLIVSHGFGDQLFSRERDFGNLYNDA